MTKLEFEEWLEYHCLAFPKLREDFTENSRSTAQWYGALKRVRLSSAKEATMEMLGDGVKFGEHVSAVKAYAKKHNGMEGVALRPKKRFVGGEEVYTCSRCRDQGHVLIFTIEAAQAMKAGGFTWAHAHALLAVGCQCEWGRAIAACQRLPLFNSQWMVDAPCGHDAPSIARLAEMMGVPVPVIDVPQHVRPAASEAARLLPSTKPLASLLASAPTVQPVVAQASDGRVYDESEASVEGPWTPDMDIPF